MVSENEVIITEEGQALMEAVENVQSGKLTAYDEVKAGLLKLRDHLKIVPDASTDEGYEEIKNTLAKSRDFKKELKEAKAAKKKPLDAYIKMLKEGSEEIEEEINDMFAPWQKARKDWDAKEEERRSVAREAKVKRVSEIKERIEGIKNTVAECINYHSDDVGKILESVIEEDVEDGSFEEFTDDAIVQKQMTLESLKQMYNDRVKFEKEKEANRIEREALDKQKAEMEAKQADHDLRERERLHQENAEREVIELARKKKEAQEKAEREAIELERREKEAAIAATPARQSQFNNSCCPASVNVSG